MSTKSQYQERCALGLGHNSFTREGWKFAWRRARKMKKPRYKDSGIYWKASMMLERRNGKEI